MCSDLLSRDEPKQLVGSLLHIALPEALESPFRPTERKSTGRPEKHVHSLGSDE